MTREQIEALMAGTEGLRAGALPAWFTVEVNEVAGPLYYFAPAHKRKPPYLKQRHVEAIIDIADDGTLAGVELIDNMPLPPTPPDQGGETP